MAATKHEGYVCFQKMTSSVGARVFVNIMNEGMRLTCKRVVSSDSRTVYHISSNFADGPRDVPIIELQFGPANSLGTVTLIGHSAVPMSTYWSNEDILGFHASDKNYYQWSYLLTTEHSEEWTCTNRSGDNVAYYGLKHPSDPLYVVPSGCMLLSIEKAFGHLASELIAAMVIMSHIFLDVP
ncbi:hypothetical protein B0H34DRAFT_679220 [Crassisporium funariophilum]|nr:hypothetical protein B0H34DRAFT_679220 [Crassisporium funariophilum]